MKVKDVIDQYMKYILITKSPGTLRYLKGKIGIIKKYLGDFDCDEIDRDILLDFIITQRKRNPKISNITLNKYISALKQILKHECGIDINFDKLKQVNKVVPTIPLEVSNIVFNHYKKHLNNKHSFRNYIFFRLLYDTGLRIKEILNLRVMDIDFETNSILVRITKTDNERYVFFTNSTKTLLLKFVKKYNLKKLLFNDFEENILSYEAIVALTNRLKKRLNIKISLSPHKWRHTFATRFLKNTGDLESLRLILGHTSIKTTQRYLHLDKDYLSKVYLNMMN